MNTSEASAELARVVGLLAFEKEYIADGDAAAVQSIRDEISFAASNLIRKHGASLLSSHGGGGEALGHVTTLDGRVTIEWYHGPAPDGTEVFVAPPPQPRAEGMVLDDAMADKIAGAGINGFGNHVADLRNRLQSAHEAEVAELRKQLQFWKDSSDDVHNLWQEDKDCADRAVGLLRECSPYLPAKGLPATVTARVHAFLSEQAGERENGDG